MSSECPTCEEYRNNEADPDLICGYCKAAKKNEAKPNPCVYARIEELSATLGCPALAPLARIIKLAEQVDSQKIDLATLELAIESFKSKDTTRAVSLKLNDWEFLIKNFLPTDSKISRGHVIRAAILEQLRR